MIAVIYDVDSPQKYAPHRLLMPVNLFEKGWTALPRIFFLKNSARAIDGGVAGESKFRSKPSWGEVGNILINNQCDTDSAYCCGNGWRNGFCPLCATRSGPDTSCCGHILRLRPHMERNTVK
jgi:hypothetical protein